MQRSQPCTAEAWQAWRSTNDCNRLSFNWQEGSQHLPMLGVCRQSFAAHAASLPGTNSCCCFCCCCCCCYGSQQSAVSAICCTFCDVERQSLAHIFLSCRHRSCMLSSGPRPSPSQCENWQKPFWEHSVLGSQESWDEKCLCN